MGQFEAQVRATLAAALKDPRFTLDVLALYARLNHGLGPAELVLAAERRRAPVTAIVFELRGAGDTADASVPHPNGAALARRGGDGWRALGLPERATAESGPA